MNEWTVSDELINYVLSHTEKRGRILEFGSGESTVKYSVADRQVTTVEHDEKFMLGLIEQHKQSLNGVEFIYAPIKLYDANYTQPASIAKRIHTHTGWYDHVVLREALRDQHWDIIVVDGPTRNYGRSGLLHHLDIFPDHALDCPIIFDDVHRIDDLYVAERVATKLGRDLLITNHGEIRTRQKANGDWQATEKKPFGVVLSIL